MLTGPATKEFYRLWRVDFALHEDVSGQSRCLGTSYGGKSLLSVCSLGLMTSLPRQNNPKNLVDRLAPWHAEQMPGLRMEIKRTIIQENAVKSRKLLQSLKKDFGL